MKNYALLLGFLLSLSFISSCDKNDPGTVINNNTNNYNIEEKDFWEPTNGPYKTYVQKMIFDSDDNLYIVGQEPPQSDSLGRFTPSMIYKSQDYGKNWDILFQGEREAGLIYTASFNQLLNFCIRKMSTNSIYMSSDKGASWTKLMDSIPGMQILSFLGTNSRGSVFAIAFKYENSKGIYKLFESTDLGKSWSERYSIEQCTLTGYIDKKDNIILAVPKKINSQTLLQFLRSTDDGSTWNKFYEYYDLSQSGFDAYEDNHGNLILNNTILSTDQGQTWKQIGTKGLYNGYFYKMSTNNKGNLYWASSAGLYRSTDKGDSWTLAIRNNDINSVTFDSKGYMYALMGFSMINRTKQPFE